MMKESEMIEKAKKGYKQELNEIPDNPEFLNQLKEMNNEKKPSFFMLWISKPIPAYSLVLSGLLFFLLFFFVTPKTTELIVYKTPKTIIQYDTIVRRDTLTIETEITKLKPKQTSQSGTKRPQQKSKKKNLSSPIQFVNNGEFYFDANQVNQQQNLSGTSTADSELAQFLGVSI